jgi:hypothetical protein
MAENFVGVELTAEHGPPSGFSNSNRHGSAGDRPSSRELLLRQNSHSTSIGVGGDYYVGLVRREIEAREIETDRAYSEIVRQVSLFREVINVQGPR